MITMGEKVLLLNRFSKKGYPCVSTHVCTNCTCMNASIHVHAGSRTTPQQGQFQGQVPTRPISTRKTTHQDQYLHGGEVSWSLLHKTFTGEKNSGYFNRSFSPIVKSVVKIMLTRVFRFYPSFSPVKVLCNGPLVGSCLDMVHAATETGRPLAPANVNITWILLYILFWWDKAVFHNIFAKLYSIPRIIPLGALENWFDLNHTSLRNLLFLSIHAWTCVCEICRAQKWLLKY